MIISLASPRFDPMASMFLYVEDFRIGKERIHKTSAALAGSIELQDTGIRMQSAISIIIKNADDALYKSMQYLTENHPILNVSHPDGLYKIAPSSAKITSGGTVTLNALVVGVV